jgi:hypothetical protein
VGNADHTIIDNCTLVDFNAQIKGNGVEVDGTMVFPDDVLIENSELFNVAPRSTANPVTPIDVVGGQRWIVRANFIHDFEKEGSDRISYAAFFKGNSSDGVFERNLVICEWLSYGGIRLGLSFGGGGSSPDSVCEDSDCSVEHRNGLMRNNIIAHCPSDVGIYLNEAMNSKIYNNIVYDTTGIDVRFTPTTADIRNNLISGEIRERDGGSVSEGSNLEDISPEQWEAWFTDPDAVDFTLRDGSMFVDEGESVAEVRNDFCENDRNDGEPDIGPVEYDSDDICDTTHPYGDTQSVPAACGAVQGTVRHRALTSLLLFPLIGIFWLRRKSRKH